MKRKLFFSIILLAVVLVVSGCGRLDTTEQIIGQEEMEELAVQEGGRYSEPLKVAIHIYLYERLPANYITKSEAASEGWESSKGNLWEVTDEMSIGGDRFGNREGRLPDAGGRHWYECDVNYYGGYRGPERLVYSNDGLIYYTDDHYETFTEIIFEENQM